MTCMYKDCDKPVKMTFKDWLSSLVGHDNWLFCSEHKRMGWYGS